MLQADKSLNGLGAVLTQVQDGKEQAITYASRMMRKNEKNLPNYSSFTLELFVAIWVVTEKFAGILMKMEFLLLTDNKPLGSWRQHN